MKKYRRGYDYAFIAEGGRSFNYKEDLIGGMSINVLFKLFRDGQEIFFDKEDETIDLNGKEHCYLFDLLTCSFDRETILRFDLNTKLLNKSDSAIEIKWEIDSFQKDIGDGFLVCELITEKEFMDIMKANLDRFDNKDNKGAQTTSYFWKEVKQKGITHRPLEMK